jgi:diguanylate cyclase (GGDEF)-like protein
MSSRGRTASRGSTPPPVDATTSVRPNGESSRARFGWRRPLSIVNAVWWLNGAIAATAVGLFIGVVGDFAPLDSPHMSWWLLAIGFFVAERGVVHLQFRRSAHSFSLGDIPLVFGLVFASAPDLLVGGLIGTGATLMLDRRLPPIKLVFNLAQFALATCLATMVMQALASNDGVIGPQTWAAAFLATQAAAVITVLLIGLAISLSEGALQAKTLGHMLGMDFVVTVTNTSLALAGTLVVSTDARAIPLLLVPAVTVFLAYRAYLLERQRHERLEFLYEATRTLSRSPEIVLALEGLLARSLEAFRAELAEIVLFGSDGTPPLRTTLGPGDYKEVMEPMPEGIAEELRALVDADRPALRLERPFGSERLRSYLDGRLVTDAMLAMLPGEQRVIGTMMLANRYGVIRSFTDEDLKLFETLANNASVALQYDRLEQAVLQLRELQEQLHHQAFHDPLTDLANRSLFINRVRDALESGAGEVAVLFIDLDDFKTFNDSFGHGAGDELLTAVSNRLRESVRPADTIARLGGDEFAVMVQDRRAAGPSAVILAERIMRAFSQPVRAADEIISVHLSIGIATTHEAREADELIRNADLAMYRAKETGKGRFEIFQPRMRDAVLKRHGLKEELQRAVERDQVVVEYQPIVALRTGTVEAAEALVRWNHPGRGRLMPSEFVPLAEETGMIIAVGQFVLEQACRQAQAWNETVAETAPVAIHVNLSAVELKDPSLTDGVMEILARTGLDPRLLVLEITESLVQDADASLSTLDQLRQCGVQLALDDFGTGYSSLSYLRSLPLDILKIAKPFVEGMARGRQENSFVRMIVDLARALDLRVVAEGIESEDELDALRELGCELGQGFYLAAPLAADKTLPGAVIGDESRFQARA